MELAQSAFFFCFSFKSQTSFIFNMFFIAICFVAFPAFLSIQENEPTIH